MGKQRGRSTAEMLEWTDDPSSDDRLDEERARRILERAAAFDAERSSEIEIGQLREAAAAAGISPESFDRAIREQSDTGSRSSTVSAVRTPDAVAVTRYAALLRDLLGDDVRITVVEDRIEARDEDQGVRVSIVPSSGEATATVMARASLQRRISAIVWPALIPAFFGFLLALEEGDPGIGVMIGVVFTVVAAGIGTLVSHRREEKELEKKAERVRRQLQRMLGSLPFDG